MKIAFDIDEVLVRFMDALAVRLGKRNVRIVRNGSYKIETDPPLADKEIAQEIFQTVRDHSGIQFYDHALEALLSAHLMSGSQPVQLVTSRPKSLAHRTHMLIDRLVQGAFPYTIGFSCERIPKTFLIDRDTRYFVEDRRQVAKEMAERGIMVFLLDRPWNQMSPTLGIIRVRDLKEVLSFFS